MNAIGEVLLLLRLLRLPRLSRAPYSIEKRSDHDAKKNAGGMRRERRLWK
jgi:hypothetical protein